MFLLKESRPSEAGDVVQVTLFVFLSVGRKSNMEEVQDELMHRLTLGRSAQKKFQGPARSGSTSSVSITYDSTPEEVKAWLEAKGFSLV